MESIDKTRPGIDMDLRNLSPDRDGLADFSWPVSRDRISSVRDAVQKMIPKVAADHAKRDPVNVRFLSSLSHLLSREAMNLFGVMALLEYSKREGCSLNPAQSSRLLAPIQAGRMPDVPFLLKFLQKAYPSQRRLLAPARWARDLLMVRDGLARRYFRAPSYADDIICIAISRAISLHASRCGEKVVYTSLANWFGELDQGLIDQERRVVAGFPAIDDIVARTAAIFATHDGPLVGIAEEYLRHWLIEGAAVTGLRLNALLQQKEKLPKRLWTGTGGQPLSRILRQAVRLNGGHVTGHDHAYGVALWRRHAHMVTEFEECDAFVTFTPEQAKGLEETADSSLTIQKASPGIIGLEQPEATIRSPLPARKGPVRRVMYLMDSYYGDDNAMYPFAADPVVVDWQARLLNRLRAWGYDVHMKPHPESALSTPAYLADITGNPPLPGRFEDHLADFDAILFDNPYSTTFGVALGSDKGVVLVDFGVLELRDEIRDAMRRRCYIVPGRFDDDNRLQTDWDELACALKECPSLRDSWIKDHYLRGTG